MGVDVIITMGVSHWLPPVSCGRRCGLSLRLCGAQPRGRMLQPRKALGRGRPPARARSATGEVAHSRGGSLGLHRTLKVHKGGDCRFMQSLTWARFPSVLSYDGGAGPAPRSMWAKRHPLLHPRGVPHFCEQISTALEHHTQGSGPRLPPRSEFLGDVRSHGQESGQMSSPSLPEMQSRFPASGAGADLGFSIGGQTRPPRGSELPSRVFGEDG